MAAGRKANADPIRQMQDLKRDLKGGRIRNLYLFYGEEGYLREQCVDIVKTALFPEDDNMNVTRFSSEHLSEKTILDLADTMPFFAEHRLIDPLRIHVPISGTMIRTMDEAEAIGWL